MKKENAETNGITEQTGEDIPWDFHTSVCFCSTVQGDLFSEDGWGPLTPPI